MMVPGEVPQLALDGHESLEDVALLDVMRRCPAASMLRLVGYDQVMIVGLSAVVPKLQKLCHLRLTDCDGFVVCRWSGCGSKGGLSWRCTGARRWMRSAAHVGVAAE